MEFAGPLTSNDVPKRGERSVHWSDCHGQPAIMRSHPVLNGEPLRASALHQVSRGVNRSLLNLIGELRSIQSDWEGEIDSFLFFGVLLIDGVVELNLLFGIEQKNFKLDGASVRCRTLESNGVSPRRLLCTKIFASLRAVNRQVSFRECWVGMDYRCRRVAAGHVDVLSKTVWAFLVDN